MRRPVRKAALLGSGVMGSGIAAHLANAGIRSLVLDIVPREPNEAEQKAGLTLEDRAVRDRIARDSIQALLKTRPAPLYAPERIGLIEVGNLEDDLARLQECDWIIEVVKEDLDIKKKVLAAAAPHIPAEAVLSTNTSGLSIAAMAAVLPEELRPRFLGTHFFNPPRYMRLFELVPGPDTDPQVVTQVAELARDRLGKGVVVAKDTPNFIANRVGVHAMMATVEVMQELGLTIEEMDALSGPAVGRPKTATFQLADLVGLDTFLHVADNLYPLVPGDEARETFKAPDYLRRMVERGLLGRKSGGGFYSMQKTPEGRVFHTLDLETLEYREKQKARFPELDLARGKDDLGERLRTLVWAEGRAAEAVWKLLAPTFSYSAMRLGEICEHVAEIDRAMRWGFNWELGPFEAWDALGFRKVTERLRADGRPLPAWIDALYDAGDESLYVVDDGRKLGPTAEPGRRAPLPEDPRALDFELLRHAGGEVRRNPGASLLDLGEGVLGLEFHSKMNAIGQDTINMINTACDEAERNWRALVVTNPAENFSVGANLMLLLMAAQEGDWDDVDLIVRAFQGANDRLEFCGVPVVTAPAGLALGGGCEVTMAGNAVRAAAETYIGLVEFGAGVIPAGGGCVRLYQRNVEGITDGVDIYPALRKTFETIGMAKVATSAEEARGLGFLRPGDAWSLNRAHLARDARDLALALADAGWIPPHPRQDIPVLGTDGIALAGSFLFNMREGQYISDHDQKIGMELGRILSGGEVPPRTTVTHERMLELERESFLRLMGERKTLERMQHILKTGKPLRN
ncbi:MAG: 3-hydroxyacyl-CoA dehydrogenase/enoyl-CoA hydratase family protein [Candidatus Krumholzibacteriia bacterium]